MKKDDVCCYMSWKLDFMRDVLEGNVSLSGRSCIIVITHWNERYMSKIRFSCKSASFVVAIPFTNLWNISTMTTKETPQTLNLLIRASIIIIAVESEEEIPTFFLILIFKKMQQLVQVSYQATTELSAERI